jgi:hypothetical protein
VAEKPELPDDEDEEDAQTQPWPRGPVRAAPAGDVAARMEAVRLETPTAVAAQSAMFTEPAGTRADELLAAFRAQDHSDALQFAARGLRAFTGVEEASPRPASLRAPARSAAPLSRRQAPMLDEDDDPYLPPPRSGRRARSRWPLAVFALGVLVLFAAWLYRPTLVQGVLGLRDLVLPQPSTSATDEPPPSSPQAAPEPDIADPASSSAPARAREARAADGAQRRRD